MYGRRLLTHNRMSGLGLGGILLMFSPVWGHADSNQTQSGSPAASQPAEATSKTVVSDENLGLLRPGRAPLLREGSLLVDVRGWMRFDTPTRSWRYVIDEDDESAPGYTLIMLPNTILTEMVQLHAIARGKPVSFEASGKVLVYRGKSYFLPTHAPQMVKFDAPRVDDQYEEIPDDSSSSSRKNNEDSVSSIMRDLEQKVGSIARTTSTMDASGLDSPNLLLEGSMIVSRRGRIVRSNAGSWMFVFDADASGLGDPPMTLFPCLLLERIEDYASRRGGVAPIMLSGQVFIFNNQNYLYPTVFQIPRERSRLTP